MKEAVSRQPSAVSPEGTVGEPAPVEATESGSVSATPTTPSAAAPAPVRTAWSEGPVVAFVRRHATPFIFLGAVLVLLPGLGYGFWDPWETHYAEVARRITTDGDWVSLHWGNADSAPSDVGRHFLFFSKPILTFWLMALSFLVFGVSEAAARLPIVLLSAGAVAGTFYYLRRLVPERAALLSAVLLLFTPLWAMLGRHAMTDMPFVAPVTVGTLAFAAVLLDPRTNARHAYVGYVCLALATLAKGLLGFLLPGAALLAMLVVTGDLSPWRARPSSDGGAPLAPARSWLVDLLVAVALVVLGVLAGFLAGGQSGVRWGGAIGGALAVVVAILAANGDRWKCLRMPLGIPIFLLLCATWYVPVMLRHGMVFVREFFLLHHFGRAVSGAGLDLTGLDLHAGTAGYYLQQLGYALFPWIVALPAAAIAWARHVATERGLFAVSAAEDEGRPPTGALLALIVAWAVIPYVVFTTSEVKFHHYIFPALPALAVLAGVGLDRLLRRGVGRWESVALLAGGVLLALVWRELRQDPHRLVRLFSYRYTRRFPEFPWMRIFLAAVLAVAAAGGLGALLAGWRRARRGGEGSPGWLERLGGPLLVGASLLASAVLSGAAMWGHVPEMSHWISQQDAFAALDAEPRQPNDRLVSWANNWRGEVVYSRDRVIVVEPGDKQAEAKLRGILRQPGRVFFVTTDARGLRGAVGRAVGAVAAREHFRLLTAEGSGGFAAAVYDGPTAGTYEPRVAALPAEMPVPPAAAGGTDVTLSEPRGRGRLTLVGVRLAPLQVRRGSTVTVDLYFRCEMRTSRDWEVFIHADGPPPSRQPRAGNGDHGFTGGAVATSACRPGELLLDRWELEISAGAEAGTYQVFAGLWHPPSGDRMRVEPGAAVRSPGGETGALEPEVADRVYAGDIVVVQ